MAFRRLDYQERALDALDAWLERLGEERARTAKAAAFIAENPDAGLTLPNFPAKAWERLAADKGVPGGRAYSPRASGDGRPVPNSTLKVPTGGGKTYLACAALSRVFGRYVGRNTGMVLWIVPNEAIYAQTLKALRDRDHPNRQTLDRAAAGRVKVLEKGDPLSRADVDAHLCVMVLMLQSSNRENKDALRLFRDRGDVHGFLPAGDDPLAHRALLDAVPNLSIYDLGDGMAPGPLVKSSMGNAMRIVRPVVIMDEGQRAVSDLAYGTLYGFNPSLVLELTATPKDVAPRPGKTGRIANILCAITGRELEREGMIKMPMNVASIPAGDWQATLGLAWDRLEALEQAAGAHHGDGGLYVRPILLVQVERTGAEQADAGFIHANDARDWLKAVARLDDDQIAFKTAERNDLDRPENRDLLSPRCRVRAIITKAALAEGWDCPFAYVLCALAANGNEAAMTQLVGRVLRQPHAMKTGVDALDECYVFAHRADTAATVAAIKKGLEGDGLGDLASDVMLAGGGAGDGVAPRRVTRRDEFRLTDIALPQVVTIEADGRPRPLDAETDLFPLVDWSIFDLDALARRLPKDAHAADAQFARLIAGDGRIETVAATSTVSTAPFDAAFAVRTIGDLVPNAFTAWSLIDRLLGRLRELGWDDALLSRLAAFVADQLRRELATERDRQAATLFAQRLGSGQICFALRGDDTDWHAPDHVVTTLPDTAQHLSALSGGPLRRSLFLPIYASDLNDDEQRVARLLDGNDAVRWWHRNAATRGSYGLRGWRRGNVYADFLFTVLRGGGCDRIVVLETKGEQLAGNHDTAYKTALLEVLSDAARRGTTDGSALDHGHLDFRATVMVFDQIDARLPTLIRAKDDAAVGRL